MLENWSKDTETDRQWCENVDKTLVQESYEVAFHFLQEPHIIKECFCEFFF